MNSTEKLLLTVMAVTVGALAVLAGLVAYATVGAPTVAPRHHPMPYPTSASMAPRVPVLALPDCGDITSPTACITWDEGAWHLSGVECALPQGDCTYTPVRVLSSTLRGDGVMVHTYRPLHDEEV